MRNHLLPLFLLPCFVHAAAEAQRQELSRCLKRLHEEAALTAELYRTLRAETEKAVNLQVALETSLRENDTGGLKSAIRRWRSGFKGTLDNFTDTVTQVMQLHPGVASEMKLQHNVAPLAKLAAREHNRVVNAVKAMQVAAIVNGLIGKGRPLQRLVEATSSSSKKTDDTSTASILNRCETIVEPALFSTLHELTILADNMKAFDNLPESDWRKGFMALKKQLAGSAERLLQRGVELSDALDRTLQRNSTAEARIAAMTLVEKHRPDLMSKSVIPIAAPAHLSGRMYRTEPNLYLLEQDDAIHTLEGTLPEIRMLCRWIHARSGKVAGKELAAHLARTAPSPAARFSQLHPLISSCLRVARSSRETIGCYLSCFPDEAHSQQENSDRLPEQIKALDFDAVTSLVMGFGSESLSTILVSASSRIACEVSLDGTVPPGASIELWIKPGALERTKLNQNGGTYRTLVNAGKGDVEFAVIGGKINNRPLRQVCRQVPTPPAVLTVTLPADFQPEKPPFHAAGPLDIDRLLQEHRETMTDETPGKK